MSETAIVKFDSEVLSKKLSAILQDQFAALIPEETWNTMVQLELKKFFEDAKDSYGYNQSRVIPSKFSQVVQAAIEAKVKVDIAETLKTINIYPGQEPDEATQQFLIKFITEAGPALVMNMFNVLMQNGLYSIKSSLISQGVAI